MHFAVIIAVAIEYPRKYCWSVYTAWTRTILRFGILSLLWSTSTVSECTSFQILAGAGLGALNAASTIPMRASFAENDVGLAMGMIVSGCQAGGVVGVSIGSTIFSKFLLPA